jgi:hypothetical protein
MYYYLLIMVAPGIFIATPLLSFDANLDILFILIFFTADMDPEGPKYWLLTMTPPSLTLEGGVSFPSSLIPLISVVEALISFSVFYLTLVALSLAVFEAAYLFL